MNLHNYIFSKKPGIRISRHLVFWLSWWIYFLASRLVYPKTFLSWRTGIEKMKADNQTGVPNTWSSYWTSDLSWNAEEIIRLLFMFSIHIAACYFIIYILLPRFLLTSRYAAFTLGLFFTGALMAAGSRLVDVIIIPSLFPYIAGIRVPVYESIFYGVINAIRAIAAAVVIRLGKDWWLKQRQKEKIETEKIETELRILKAQIHPGFLFNSLNHIYDFALKASPRTPEMLLKLSEILSYMLYECNERLVPLDREIKILRDYVSLEQIRYGGRMDINMKVDGSPDNLRIAPLLMLQLIEYSFQYSGHRLTEKPWLNLEIELKDCRLALKVVNGKPVMATKKEMEDSGQLALVQRRLNLIYPGQHGLKVTEESEIMITQLELELEKGNGQQKVRSDGKLLGAVDGEQVFSLQN